MRLWRPRLRGIRSWFAARLGLRTAPVTPACPEASTVAKVISTGTVSTTTNFLQPIAVEAGVIRIATLPRTPGLAHLVGLLNGSTPQDHRA